jgi:uncharacterized damage-inducible protein DinB
MARTQAAAVADLGQALVEPGSRGRTIAAIFSHVHNVRRKWLRLSAPHLTLPVPLDGRCSQEQAAGALAESAARCCEMLADALTRPERRVEIFCRDGWARTWPAGAAMVAYMISHDAHHRGQVCMLAHQLGFPCLPRAPAGCGFGKNCGTSADSRTPDEAVPLSPPAESK